MPSILLVSIVSVLTWGCASQPSAPPGAANGAPVSPQRSARGNPPFYEVFGVRYYVLNSSDNFVERGVASWYGRDFHRSPTSSGEPYDMYGMTAAHKTLPLPTWVEVRNLENGRSVTVRVNDRGPFVGDRIIDLSYAAAQELDMVQAGTARVEVRALGAAPRGERTLQASTAAPPREDARGGFSLISEAVADTVEPADRMPQLFIQVGAFSQRNNAQELAERLRGGGFDNAFVLSSDADALHRVRVGPFMDVGDYDRANDGLRRFGLADTRLVVD